MKSRVEVLDTEIAVAFSRLGDALKAALTKHGRDGYIGPHEIKGAIDEEVLELALAIHANDNAATVKELLDIGVGAIFGAASLMAIERAKREVKI